MGIEQGEVWPKFLFHWQQSISAMFMPVIATDAGGCAEVVDDLRYMVPVRDADALAAKMAQIAAMTLAERETLGEINRWRVARFDLESICDRWEKIYAEKEGDIQR